MKERPILFQGAMVRALLAGTKTQTRRVVKAPPRHWSEWRDIDGVWHPTEYTEIGASSAGLFIQTMLADGGKNTPAKPSPYGVPGDRLWVRETFDAPPGSELIAEVAYRADFARDPKGATWRPSIYMPRWASRITLEVTSVRAERLQSISDDDALDEGISREGLSIIRGSARQRFADLWDEINGKRAPWSTNPWLWVVSFRRVTS